MMPPPSPATHDRTRIPNRSRPLADRHEGAGEREDEDTDDVEDDLERRGVREHRGILAGMPESGARVAAGATTSAPDRRRAGRGGGLAPSPIDWRAWPTSPVTTWRTSPVSPASTSPTPSSTRWSVSSSVILEAVATVQQAPIADVEPMSHPMPIVNVTRPDVVRPSLAPGAALAAAPESEQQRFSVPRILDEE